MDQTIRPANVAVLIKLETTEGTDAAPGATTDAIPVEADSVSYNTPWTQEASNEATGSLVAGAPLVIGQPATISFRSRIKGAGVGSTYSSTVKPPLHQAFQACGWRGQFTAAVATAVASAGTATSLTLNASYSAIARALIGMALSITAGAGVGATPVITEYPATQSARYEQLLDAIALDVDAAFASASYGAFQILGENWNVCGEDSSLDFALTEANGELGQLRHFTRFCASNGLVPALRRKDWAAFARGYNGTAYRVNRYDEKLAAAYRARGGR